MSVSFGSKKQTTQQQSQSDPWSQAIPYVTDLLSKTKAASADVGPTAKQSDAYAELESNAAAGNPYAGSIDKLATDLYGSTSYSPEVASGYTDLEKRLTPTANGENLDLSNNPQLQAALKTAADDAQWRINSMFAGAGRDLSGINQQSVSRGITQAEAPILLNQYNTEQQRTDAAARDLNTAKVNAATTKSGLDSATATLRQAGINVGNEALAAKDYGPNQILQLEDQLKNLPYDELSKLAALIYPAAGLGGTSSGTATQKGTSFGVSADLGKALAKPGDALLTALLGIAA